MVLVNHVIELENFNFSYSDEFLFQDFSWTIKSGEFITIAGNTGGGKTTLVKLLAGQLKINGTYRLNSDIVSFQSPELISKTVRVVMGDPFFNFAAQTVREGIICMLRNVDYNSKTIHKSILEMAELFGVETLLDLPPEQLSRNQMVCISLVSALATNPKILILDDAFLQLSFIEKRKIFKLLKKLNRRDHLTILNFTHDMEEVIYSSHFAVLYRGQIVLTTSVKKLTQYEKELKQYHLRLPNLLELSNKLKYYGLLDEPILDMNRLVNHLWK